MNGRDDEDGSDDLPWFVEGSASYIERGHHLNVNISCPNARDICPGLWWHNTPTCGIYHCGGNVENVVEE